MRGRENRDNNQHEHLLIGFIPFLLPNLLCLSAKPVLTSVYSLLQYLCHEEDALSISCRRISIVSNHKCQSEQKIFSIHNKSSHTLTSHSLFIGKEKEANCTLYLESPTNLKYTNQHPFESVLVSVHQLPARRKRGSAKCLRGRPRRR